MEEWDESFMWTLEEGEDGSDAVMIKEEYFLTIDNEKNKILMIEKC